jgi:hypothetical protein
MTRAVWGALLAVVLLGSCGGGDVDVALAPQAVDIASSGDASGQRDQPLRLESGLTAAGLFDWAQQNLPQYFPGPGVDGQAPPFTYRYFPATNSFLAVSSSDEGVYVLGPEISNNQIRFLAPFALFRCRLTPSACPTVQLGQSVTGTVASGQQSWYAIQLSAGQPYRLELEGTPTGQGTLEDPLLRLMNPSGQLITDDDSGVSFNARIVCTPSTSGLHFISASAFEDFSGSYRLSATVSSVPAPDCASIVGDGQVDWESPFSAADIVSGSVALDPSQVLGGVFSISGGTAAVDLIFAAQQTATLHVTTPEGLAACTSGGAFTPLASFTGQAAARTVSLAAGSYGLCVRNMSGVPNPIRLEVKKQPVIAGFHYARDRFAAVARTINPGGRFAQPATTAFDFRTLIDGASTGGTFHIVNASEVQKFLAGLPFNDYPELTAACAPAGAAAPELCELTDVENYSIVYHNDTASAQSIVIIGRDYAPD